MIDITEDTAMIFALSFCSLFPSPITPSAVGDTVSATAVLKEVEGRKLTFEVRARVRGGRERTHL